MLSNVSEHDIMQCAYQCRVQSACFCCPKDNILSPLAHFTARQTQTAGGRERLGPKSATKNCLKPDITGKRGRKKRDKCREAFQRSFLFVAQSSFLAAGFLDSAKAQSFLGLGGSSQRGNYKQELCHGHWACQRCEVTCAMWAS